MNLFNQLKFNRDLNFLLKEKYLKPNNLKRTLLVFLSSFFIVFSILNAQAIYNQVNFHFASKPDEQQANLELENLYKAQYGHSINGLSVSSDLNLSVLEDGLVAIGKATVGLNEPNSTALSDQVQQATLVNKNSNSNFISISKINIKAPIVEPISADQKKILASLKSGVVLYPGSALPGKPGTTVIIGHSSSNLPITKYSSVFAGLNRLNVGDLIYINYGNQKYVYIIKDKKIGSNSELASLNVGGDLILASCWPVGTDKNRIIIVAELQ